MTRRSIAFILFFSALLWSNALQAQLYTTANTGGTGWKRIAEITGSGARGFGTVSLYAIGGSFRPIATTIEWFHDWATKAGVSVRSNTEDSPYWPSVRITNDGTNTYIEVYFSVAIDELGLISDNYGWHVATPYTGILPNGGGDVRASTVNARLSIEEKLVVRHNGNVGIGTADPQAKLAVDGTVLATEVKVKNDITVPDYVFEPDYDLATLSEIEAHIREYKHLPEVPSAADIRRDGLDLAEMNLLLLKKVEELTLHVIALKKELDDQKALIKAVNQQPDNPLTEAR